MFLPHNTVSCSPPMLCAFGCQMPGVKWFPSTFSMAITFPPSPDPVCSCIPWFVCSQTEQLARWSEISTPDTCSSEGELGTLVLRRRQTLIWFWSDISELLPWAFAFLNAVTVSQVELLRRFFNAVTVSQVELLRRFFNAVTVSQVELLRRIFNAVTVSQVGLLGRVISRISCFIHALCEAFIQK